jgi:predicted dehydrogenase
VTSAPESKPSPAGGAPTRWGIAGPGVIAGLVAGDFEHVPDAELVAVGSRSQQRAEDFARAHGVARAHGSYAALIADPDVDVIYIATPHPQHYPIAIASLRAGKAVLVEKSFTATLAGAQEIVAEARRLGVFAMEAMWTRFQPAVVRTRELLAKGAIGEIVSVQADLGIVRDFDPSNRLFAPELGGGALLDLGVYVVSFAQMLLGAPQAVFTVGAYEPNGVEASASLLLGFGDGRSATLTTSLHAPLPGSARILGSDGWLELPPRFHHPTEVVLHRDGHEPEMLSVPRLGGGYAHELIEVTECVRAGRTESPVMPLDDTLAVMAALEQASTQLGVTRAEDRTMPLS